ncbi:MAG: M23 family metallopeptidase [Bacteroidales bacterium]|nr:M23 family metallopeptidase [Bacteroidales bacterium]
MKKDSLIYRILMWIFRYVALSVSAAVLFYILFSLVFSTPEEKRLQKENRLYEERYNAMVEKTALIEDVIANLQVKDNDIYRCLFKADVPSADDGAHPEKGDAVSSARLMEKARGIDAAFEEVFALAARSKDSIPPLSLPLHDYSYVQTGASVGLKYNPVYKLSVQHNGLDMIAPEGSDVLAAARGTVTSVNMSRKGFGNTVEINHGNGYVTRYCLLGDVLVEQGSRVKQGQRIGTVGTSPSLPSPHLHFEVLHDGRFCNPVNYFFASVTPEEYARMLFLSGRTEQSMD